MGSRLAVTAFDMPLYGISFPPSVLSGSSAIFRNIEKLSCANEVSQASKACLERLRAAARAGNL